MELVAYFNEFIENEVNLNQIRLDTLNQKKDVLKRVIKDSEKFKDIYIDFIPQGSVAHKTVIKPARTNKEFDADFLLLLDKVDDWEAKDYIDELYNIFKNSGTYKDIVKKKKRCIVINYIGDFHIDIVPAFENSDQLQICNSGTNTFENDNPINYKEWFFEKHRNANYFLIKSVRLFKYLRDRKGRFSISSVLLNTILGERISDNEDTAEFRNISTSFYTLFKRLNDYLQIYPTMPQVINPVLAGEDLTARNWSQEKYSVFRERINGYYNQVVDAYEEKNKEESIKKWRIVFSDDFPDSISNKEASVFIASQAKTNRPWAH